MPTRIQYCVPAVAGTATAFGSEHAICVRLPQLPVNTATITLEKTAWVAPEDVKVEGPDERAIIYRGGETIEPR